VSAALGTPVGDEAVAERRAIARAAAALGLYAAVFGLTFGAVSVGSGRSVAETMVLSLVMFSGASQFALVGLLAGGSALAGVSTALLLGVRNAFYGVPISHALRPRGPSRLWTAQLVIDETTAMTVAQRSPASRRYAFWTTGVILFTLWNAGSLVGALIGGSIDTSAFGLDAAAPAIFLALLWPALSSARARAVAAAAAAVALALVELVPAGVPVIAAAAVAIAAGAPRR